MTEFTANHLAELKFRNSANAKMVKACAAGDAAGLQKSLVKAYAGPARRFNKQFSDTRFASAWSEAIAVSDSDRKLLALLDACNSEGQSKKKASARILKDIADDIAASFLQEGNSPSPFATIVAAELLLRHIEQCTPDQVATIFCGLSRIKPQDWVSDPVPATPAIIDQLTQCVAQGEVPFVLSCLLDSLQTSKALRGTGIRKIASGLDDVTDTDGTLQALVGRNAQDWLSSYVRITGWANAFRLDWSAAKTTRRWQRALQHLCGMMTPSGYIQQQEEAGLDMPEDSSQPTRILRHGVHLASFPPSSDVASFLETLAETSKKKGQKSAKAKRKKSAAKGDRYSEQSDWAEVAVLRNSLTVDADVLALDWDERNPNLNLAALGTKLFDGEWTSQITVNGKPHEAAGTWTCTCWFEDKEVAFAELESGSADGVRHVRQVMLSLDQHIAVVTDSVTGPDDDSDIEFTSSVPVASDMEVEPDSITRELRVKRGKFSGRIIPAWLEDDRVMQAMGSCDVQNGQLKMTAKGSGGVTLPLIIEWHPERKHRDPDWNRLTVTEERKVQSPRNAAAYRIRVGTYQLLIYRSLRPGDTLRAVLGYHTAHESVYGRVKKNGDISPLVLVESEE